MTVFDNLREMLSSSNRYKILDADNGEDALEQIHRMSTDPEGLAHKVREVLDAENE